MFLIVVSWNFIRKSKADTYILKSRPPQTTAHWTKGNRLFGNPKTWMNMQVGQKSWPTVKQGLENRLTQKRPEPRSNELRAQRKQKTAAENSSRIDTPKLEGRRYWRRRNAHETGSEATGYIILVVSIFTSPILSLHVVFYPPLLYWSGSYQGYLFFISVISVSFQIHCYFSVLTW